MGWKGSEVSGSLWEYSDYKTRIRTLFWRLSFNFILDTTMCRCVCCKRFLLFQMCPFVSTFKRIRWCVCWTDERMWCIRLHCDDTVYCRMVFQHVAFFRGHKSSFQRELVTHFWVLANGSTLAVGSWQKDFCCVKIMMGQCNIFVSLWIVLFSVINESVWIHEIRLVT